MLIVIFGLTFTHQAKLFDQDSNQELRIRREVTNENSPMHEGMVAESNGPHTKQQNDLEPASDGIVFRPLFAYKKQQENRFKNN